MRTCTSVCHWKSPCNLFVDSHVWVSSYMYNHIIHTHVRECLPCVIDTHGKEMCVLTLQCHVTLTASCFLVSFKEHLNFGILWKLLVLECIV